MLFMLWFGRQEADLLITYLLQHLVITLQMLKKKVCFYVFTLSGNKLLARCLSHTLFCTAACTHPC